MVGKGGGVYWVLVLAGFLVDGKLQGGRVHPPSLPLFTPPLSFSHTPLALYSIDVYRCLGENHIGPTAEACTVL